METAKEVTAEFVKQIIRVAHEDDNPAYAITELLKEYGAKAYRQGRQELAETVRKLV